MASIRSLLWLATTPLVATAGCTLFDDTAPAPGDITVVSATSLVRIDAEPAGGACPAGGQRVSTGLDDNNDGALSDDEVEGEGVVCNGADGAMGTTLDDLACTSAQTPVYDGQMWSCQPLVVDTDTDTLADLSCVNGQVAKWNGTAWACAADATADPGTDTLANLTCGVNQIAKFNGASWFCSEDQDTVTINTDTLASLLCDPGEVPKRMLGGWACAPDLDTDTDTLADLSCGSGQVAKYNGTAWACAADADTVTMNTDTLAALSCASGQVAKYNGTAWACAADADTITVDTNTDTLADLSCNSGEVALFDGSVWTCAAAGADTLGSLSCASGEVAKYNGTAWACAIDVDTDTDTDTLAALSCASGEVAKYNGAAWACAADIDTDTDTTLDPTTLWQLGGNAGTTPGTDFLGTSDDVALELQVNGTRALSLEPHATSPSIIAGSADNDLDGAVAYGVVIGGGGDSTDPNLAYDPYGTIGGGAGNTVGADNAAATEMFSTVGGGFNNTASGANATVPGGSGNTASGAGSFAAGTQAQATHNGALLLADSTAAPFPSAADDEFAVRANGGVRFVVNGFEVTLDETTGLWSSSVISDRAEKHALANVDAEQVLQRLNRMDIGTWAYRGREERHLGPMAQDFYAAFGLGTSKERIHPLDATGVSLKAIQALTARTEALLAQNQQLAADNRALAERLARLEAERGAAGSANEGRQ